MTEKVETRFQSISFSFSTEKSKVDYQREVLVLICLFLSKKVNRCGHL